MDFVDPVFAHACPLGYFSAGTLAARAFVFLQCNSIIQDPDMEILTTNWHSGATESEAGCGHVGWR